MVGARLNHLEAGGDKDGTLMLNEERNKVLTQVGPGTPMGSLMRRYRLFSVRSSPTRTRDRSASACWARIWLRFATPRVG